MLDGLTHPVSILDMNGDNYRLAQVWRTDISHIPLRRGFL